MIWRNSEGRWETWWDQLEHNVISVLPSVCGPFPHHSLGSCPTKQLASMGIPALLSYRPLPPFPISRPLSLSCSWPQERGGQVYFLHGGLFGVVARPLPCCHWCIGWGSFKRCWWDSFITLALSLIGPVGGCLVLPFFAWSEWCVKSASLIPPASHWKIALMTNKATAQFD